LCLPLYIFLYAWQFKGAAWKTAVRDTLPFVLIILLYLVLRIAFVHNSLDVIGLQGYFTHDPGAAFLNLITLVIRNIVLYLSKLGYPEGILWNLRVSNQGPASIGWIFFPVATAALLGWIFRNTWRKNAILFLSLWFLCGFIMLLATSFVHPSSGIGIEPHWFIASSAGLFGLAGIFLFWLRTAGLPDRLWKLLLAVLILYLGYYANLYSLRWQNEKGYMQYWLSQDPSADLPNFWLAQIYHKEGQYPQASQFYCRALTGGFIDWEVYYNLGIVQHQQGHYDQAIAYFNQAHRLKPDSPDIHRRAAMSYFGKGNVGRAEELLLTALKLAPHSTQIRELLNQIKEQDTPHE
ncbi:MAG: tetratricopeptide repeat protein, partial [Candidatus Omnitrophica bacterium]|nr:tetratricopeptide repeat protein [Candidatus Omnitrophota bacterium]